MAEPEMPEIPDETLAELIEGARTLQRLFAAYQLAGFTEAQAMDILKFIIATGFKLNFAQEHDEQ